MPKTSDGTNAPSGLVMPVAVGLALVALLGIALFMHFTGSPTTMDKVREQSTLTIGYAVEPPYAFVDSGGRVTGYDPELAKLVAHELGVKNIRWRLVDFESLIPELLSGRIDVIAAGMFDTTERRTLVRFSNPSFIPRAGLLVRKSDPVQANTTNDLASVRGIRVAVIAGSVEEAELIANGINKTRLVVAPDPGTAVTSLMAGVTDAVALSVQTLRWAVGVRGDYASHQLDVLDLGQAMGARGEPLSGAFAFRVDDEELLNAWNKAMAQVMARPGFKEVQDEFGF